MLKCLRHTSQRRPSWLCTQVRLPGFSGISRDPDPTPSVPVTSEIRSFFVHDLNRAPFGSRKTLSQYRQGEPSVIATRFVREASVPRNAASPSVGFVNTMPSSLSAIAVTAHRSPFGKPLNVVPVQFLMT